MNLAEKRGGGHGVNNAFLKTFHKKSVSVTQ